MSDGWTREYVVEVRHAELIAGSPFSHPFREEIVRCRDCVHYEVDPQPIDPGWPMMCADSGRDMLEPDGFCAWAERRDA